MRQLLKELFPTRVNRLELWTRTAASLLVLLPIFILLGFILRMTLIKPFFLVFLGYSFFGITLPRANDCHGNYIIIPFLFVGVISHMFGVPLSNLVIFVVDCCLFFVGSRDAAAEK